MAASADIAPIHRRRGRLVAYGGIFAAAILVLSVVVALATGPVAIPVSRLARLALSWLSGENDASMARDWLVLMNIRLPRVVLGILLGSGLSVAGAIMQGLFRNPLADPAIVGVSSGAALAAAATIVLGDRLLPLSPMMMQGVILPIAAFVGSLLAAGALYAISTREGQTSTTTMLLAGIAISALAASGIGLLIYISDDRQLRDITFWTMGSLGGANWWKVSVAVPVMLVLFISSKFLANGLNALALGEAAAFHVGHRVQLIKVVSIVLIGLATGVGVAAAGVISFVGIVVPHLVRLAIGPDYRSLLPISALLGASLLVAADACARTIVAPADLPIGILTALVGAPFFLWLLLRRERSF
ncbi:MULTISPECIES: iron ABC transporter permease [unclassified Beijerinckia]|uniref:FecCD family ABC transporter permease n=1 Tax=unclassified Beijerinckia TaxID=2638183 RepID=UPI001FCDC409|nr:MULTISPECIES: iron ABC transporter permease [unclassified Beijerinckia]